MRYRSTLMVLFLAGCTSTTELSNQSTFNELLGARLETQRVTYIYSFNENDELSLWNHTYKYSKADSDGRIQKFEEKPKETCGIGSKLQVKSVTKDSRFDNPVTINAHIEITCNGNDYSTVYLWGFYPKIHKAPWESPVYEPQNIEHVTNMP